jgi:hypothetical protein
LKPSFSNPERQWLHLFVLSTVWPMNELHRCTKNPAGTGPAGLFDNSIQGLGELPQHLPPSIVFSVQFATEFTSWAAPRTVLQAAVASAAVISAAVTSFWIMGLFLL